MAGRSFRSAASYVAANHGDVPILRLLLGGLLLLFFTLALMLQVQTSEAFLLRTNVVSLAANWGILTQPILLAEGQLPINTAKAVIWGWGIELVYLVCVVGEVTLHGRLHGWFRTGALILVAFNFWTDFNYGSLASGFWGQVAFAGITSFIVAFFGTLGLRLVFGAVNEWNHI